MSGHLVFSNFPPSFSRRQPSEVRLWHELAIPGHNGHLPKCSDRPHHLFWRDASHLPRRGCLRKTLQVILQFGSSDTARLGSRKSLALRSIFCFLSCMKTLYFLTEMTFCFAIVSPKWSCGKYISRDCLESSTTLVFDALVSWLTLVPQRLSSAS